MRPVAAALLPRPDAQLTRNCRLFVPSVTFLPKPLQKPASACISVHCCGRK